jgi:hypothetical protein
MNEEAKNSQLKKIVELQEIPCGPIGALDTDPRPKLHRWRCQATVPSAARLPADIP